MAPFPTAPQPRLAEDVQKALDMVLQRSAR